jgi:hypothetical protein
MVRFLEEEDEKKEKEYVKSFKRMIIDIYFLDLFYQSLFCLEPLWMIVI